MNVSSGWEVKTDYQNATTPNVGSISSLVNTRGSTACPLFLHNTTHSMCFESGAYMLTITRQRKFGFFTICAQLSERTYRSPANV